MSNTLSCILAIVLCLWVGSGFGLATYYVGRDESKGVGWYSWRLFTGLFSLFLVCASIMRDRWL